VLVPQHIPQTAIITGFGATGCDGDLNRRRSAAMNGRPSRLTMATTLSRVTGRRVLIVATCMRRMMQEFHGDRIMQKSAICCMMQHHARISPFVNDANYAISSRAALPYV